MLKEIEPQSKPETRSDQRLDFEKLSDELINGSKHDEKVELEEWERGEGKPPSLAEFTLK